MMGSRELGEGNGRMGSGKIGEKAVIDNEGGKWGAW